MLRSPPPTQAVCPTGERTVGTFSLPRFYPVTEDYKVLYSACYAWSTTYFVAPRKASPVTWRRGTSVLTGTVRYCSTPQIQGGCFTEIS